MPLLTTSSDTVLWNAVRKPVGCQPALLCQASASALYFLFRPLSTASFLVWLAQHPRRPHSPPLCHAPSPASAPSASPPFVSQAVLQSKTAVPGVLARVSAVSPLGCRALPYRTYPTPAILPGPLHQQS